MDDEFDSGGFRTLLNQALRIEDNVDWSVHSVDYDQFKKRLRNFADRRVRMRNIILTSSDGRVSEQTLHEAMGPQIPLPLAIHESGSRDTTDLNDSQPMTDYTSFVEGDAAYYSGSSDADSMSSSNTIKKQKRRTKRSVMRRISASERNELTLFLSWELEKALMFYLSQWQALSRRLEQQQNATSLGQPSLDTDIGDEVLELYAFCVINIVTAHQILIRYDAFARAFEGTPIRSFFLKQVVKHPTAFRKLLFHEELNAIADSYVLGNESTPFIVQFCGQRFMFQEILTTLDYHTERDLNLKPARGSLKSYATSAWKWVRVALWEDRLGLEPAYLTGRGQSLTGQMEQLSMWRKKKHEIARPTNQKTLTGMQTFHLTLNLLSAFLYSMNHYIVEPSSTMYVNRLGAHDTMSGTLIGMLPLAAFASSIPYSMWTNRSFRHPFIMSCFLMIMGNMCYSCADVFSSFPMALAGRFISGLGAPKCIIRRYIADTTPMSLRTGVNAGFGMVVAAGSAMGPAMAILLNKYELIVAIPRIAIINLNGLTLPGYFMAALWFTLMMIVLATFEEPDRDGLKEQQEMEEKGAIHGSPTFRSNASACPEPPSELSHELMSYQELELRNIFSGESHDYSSEINVLPAHSTRFTRWFYEVRNFMELISLPVRLCLGLLFAMVFSIEALVSATSALSKNRYKWQVRQVGLLGFSNGMLVIPFSMMIGRLSLSYQDHVLMRWLVGVGCFGMFLLIDLSDLVDTPTGDYNAGHILAVSPQRYICGYFTSYVSIMAVEGIIGSTLSKVIPTALASGTFNSGLLATLIDTSGRACGDMFISIVGFINLRQLMNLLFIPGFCNLFTCLVVIERFRDLLSV